MGVSFTLVVLSGLLGFSLAFNCPESDGHFQHETRCDMYYWCVAGVPHVSHCPPGSFFSTITNFCNWPYAVSGCSDDGARTDVGGGGWSQPQPQPQPPQQQPRQPPQHLNSWEQDNHRWNDQGWDSYMAKALTGALSKVKTSGRQKREADVKAVAYQGFDICGGDDGYFRHADDCTMYWWCINGVPRIQMCQGGLFFDPVIRRCSWARSVPDCNFEGKRTLPYKSKSSHELSRHKRSTVKGYQCPSSYGYYRHPTTCNQYVWCVDSVPHLQECLGDNRFNYDIKRCDVPSKVGGCDGNLRTDPERTPFKASPHSLSRNRRSVVKGYQCPTSHGYFRHPTSCREYIWCIGSVPNRMECKGENVFDYNIRRCNKPWEVTDCDSSGRRMNPERAPFKASHGVSRKKRSVVRGYQCPNSYGYFRHPTSCRQYVWCVDGIPNLMECNGGSVFDITIKRCNFPSQVEGCSGGDRRTDPDRTPFTHLGLHPAGMDIEEPEYTCEGEEDGLWGHPKNCSIYYHCNRGKGTRFTCSPGTFFNPSTLVCSWPGEVYDCSEDGTVKDFYLRKRRSAYLKPTYPKDNDRSARSTPILDDEPYYCPEKDGYYRHETNCSVYYRCTNNKPTRFQCNPGTFYNPAMFGCSWPFQVIDCDSEGKLMPHRKRRSVFPEQIRDNHRSHGKHSELPFYKPEETYPCPITDGYYPHKKNCSVYFRCTQGKSTRFVCNPGTFYNPSILGCSWPEQVRDCDTEGNRRQLVKRKRRSIFSAPGQKEAPLRGFRCPLMDGYYRHPTDCTSYYWCVGRKPTKYSCANGTFFNPKMKLCTWPSQVTDCDMDGVRISHSPYQSRVKEFTCPRKDGYYRHPNDCASYFRCNERKLTTYKCTPGTLFDAKNSVCAWPSQVHDCTETGEVIARSFINTPQKQANVQGKPDKNTTATSTTTTTDSPTNKTKEETTFQTLPTKTTPAPATTTSTTRKVRITTAKTMKNATSRVTSRVTSKVTSRTTSKTETSGTTSTTEATTSKQNSSTSTTTAPSTSTSASTTKAAKVTQRHSANDGFGHVINTDSKGNDAYKFGTSVQSPFVCPDTEGYFSDMEDCASYYHCEHGVPYKKECGVGDFYSPLSQTCIPGHLVPDCNYDDDMTEDTTYPEWTKDYYKSYTSDFECPDLHGYFADDIDCTGYYECINGNAYHRKCNAGTYFHEKKEKCTWDKVSEKCPSAVKEDAVKETLGKMMKSGPFVCPSREGYFRDPKTCTMFYECKEGVPKSKSCGPETLFDDKKKKCTWPELVTDCDVYGRVIPSEQTLFSNKAPQQLEKNPNGFACPLPSGHFRDPRDCSIFYHCVKSVAYRGKCVNNHVFDLEALKCVDPELVPGCDVAPKAPLIEATTEETAHFDCPSDGYFREKTDCSVYYHCKDGVYFRHECKPNTVFSEEKGLCTWPHLVPGCEEKNDAPTVDVTSETMSEVAPPAEAQEPGSDYEFGESVDKASGPAGNDQEKPQVESEIMQGDTGFVCPPVIDGFYGDPIYCQRFYRCVGDKKYSFTCPSGTFFDNGRFICNFKEKVSQCTSSGLRISQAGNDAPEEVLEPEMASEVSAVVTAEPVPPCPESDGLFPHPSSCSKFLYCARFSSMVLTCPKDLVYNMEKKTCDYSDNVVCIRYD